MTAISWTYFGDRAIDRRNEAAHKRRYESARLHAASAQVAARARSDPSFRTPEADYERAAETREAEEEERLRREKWESYVKPPTLGQVGLGLDMMFAPRGAFSMPLYEASPDLAARPIEWMLTSFDDMRSLAEVREELRREKLVRACSEEFDGELSVRLATSISGRALRVGESPPL